MAPDMEPAAIAGDGIGLQHLRDHRLRAHDRLGEVARPAGEVGRGGADTGRAIGGIGEEAALRRAFLPAGRIGHRLAGAHAVIVVDDIAMVHAERPEHALREEVGKGLAGDALDHQREQRVVRVGIAEGGAGREVELALAEDHPQCVLLGNAVLAAPALQPEQAQLVAQPAAVVHEMGERDRPREAVQLGDIFAHVVVEREPALRLEEQHREGSELLGERGDVEGRVGRVGDARLDIGGAIAAGMEQQSVACDRHGASRRVRLAPRSEQLVDLARGIGGARRYDAGDQEERAGKEPSETSHTHRLQV